MRVILPYGGVAGVIRATSTASGSVGAPTSRLVIYVIRRGFSIPPEEHVAVGHATRRSGCSIGSDSLVEINAMVLGAAVPEGGSPGAGGNYVVLTAEQRSAQGH